MGKQSNQFFKVSLLVISLFVLGACSSTSETDESSSDDTQSSSNSSSSSASSSAGSNSGQLTQEQIRAQNALRQTVFYFDFDVAEFQPADRETLTYHARDLAANPNKRLRLEGHADERGTREYNLALGERRQHEPCVGPYHIKAHSRSTALSADTTRKISINITLKFIQIVAWRYDYPFVLGSKKISDYSFYC